MSERTCPTCGPTTVEQHPRQPVTRCANCKEWLTSVPPTQPPAAPETDVRLTEAPWPAAWPTAAELSDRLARVEADLSAARERVRVVEGERDALEGIAAVRTAHRDRLRDEILPGLRARAESAVAAHAALVAALEALADDFDSNVDWSAGRNNYGDNEAWESAARQARALAGGAR